MFQINRAARTLHRFVRLGRDLPVIVLIASATPILLPAQDVLMSPPSEPLLPQSLRETVTPPPASQPRSGPLTPYRIGPILLHPSLSYSYTNAEGLPSKDGSRRSSEIHTVSVSVTADLGRHWTLQYSPTWRDYSAETMTDSFSYALRLSGAASLQDWSFTFAENYSTSSPTLVETARQIKQEIWSTSVGANYALSAKTQIQTSVSMSERVTDVSPDTRTWSGRTMVSWQLSPKLNLSLGPGFSYTENVDSADTYGESYHGQIHWRPLDKITVNLGAGIQSTRADSASGVDFSSPVYNLTVGYQPFDTTGLSLGVVRTVSTSYFRDQLTENFRWNFGVQQRLLGHFHLATTYSRYNNDYVSASSLILVNRSDVVESFGASLSTVLLRRISCTLSFQRTQNTSNDAAFSFASDQYGIQVSCRF